jgi:hypothetical protein
LMGNAAGRLVLLMEQHGLLRPLEAPELSDGTLRYLLWIAALLTPRPPALMVLNEPETSLHPDLLPALARLMARKADRTQIYCRDACVTACRDAHRPGWLPFRGAPKALRGNNYPRRDEGRSSVLALASALGVGQS